MNGSFVGVLLSERTPFTVTKPADFASGANVSLPKSDHLSDLTSSVFDL